MIDEKHHLISETSNNQPKFICSKLNPPPRTAYSDSMMFIGTYVICHRVDDITDYDCDLCRANCLSVDKDCPPQCECRWY
jgi:hypothetical protein